MEITVAMYSIATVIVGVIVLSEFEFGRKNYLKGKKTVGPAYWGAYDSSPLVEAEAAQVVVLPHC